MRFRMSVNAVVIWLLVSLSSGCITPPANVRLFADKTTEMVKAIETSNKSIETLVNKDFEDEKSSKSVNGQNSKSVESRRKLQDRLNLVQSSLSAVVSYSNSLVVIADDAKKSRESFDSFFDSLETLRLSVGPIMLLPAVPEMAANVLASFKEEIDKNKANRTISLAVTNAEPVIQTIAKVLNLILDKLSELNSYTENLLQAEIYLDNSHLFAYHRILIQNDKQAIISINLIGEYRQNDGLEAKAESLKKLREIDPTFSLNPSMEYLSRKEREIISTASLHRAELVRIEPAYRAIKEQEKTLRKQIKDNKIFIEKSQVLISAWAKAHTNLKVAMEQKQKINLLELSTAIQDLIMTYQPKGN